jgi:hypothetical protein
MKKKTEVPAIIPVPAVEIDSVVIGSEVIPANIEEATIPKRIRCLDCGGWPIPHGAMFIPVVTCKDGSKLSDVDTDRRGNFTPLPSVGFICELCFVWRLERRAQIVASTSTPKPYYSFKNALPLLRNKALEQRTKKVGRDDKSRPCES